MTRGNADCQEGARDLLCLGSVSLPQTNKYMVSGELVIHILLYFGTSVSSAKKFEQTSMPGLLHASKHRVLTTKAARCRVVPW